MRDFIPWAKPHLFGNEIEFVRDAIESTWISSGPYVEQLETKCRDYFGVQNAFALSNGTAAIELVYHILNLQPGDEVIVPGFAYQAAANLALLHNLKPVFTEVDPQTWCVRAEDIEPKVTHKTKAIVVVHTYGNVCDMKPIMAFAKSKNIPVIEDTAEAFGSLYAKQYAGTLGDFGTYSFQATKTVMCGEGGLLVSNNADYADAAALYRSHGMRRKDRFYWHEVPGNNYRLTNLQAAVACAQLEHLEAIFHKRSDLALLYQKHLSKLETSIQLQRFSPHVDPVVWAIGLKLNPGHYPQGRDKVIAQMRDKGVEMRPGFYTPTQQPLYDSVIDYTLPVSEELASLIVLPPIHLGMNADDVAYVCESLMEISV